MNSAARHKAVHVFFSIMLGLALLCGHSAHAGADGAAEYAFGSTQSVLQKDIGAKGAALAVQQSGTPLDGLVLDVPAGAFPRDGKITIGYNNGTLKLNTGTPSGQVAVIDFGGVQALEKPVTIRVSYAKTEQVSGVVGYAIDDRGRLEPVTLSRIDPDLNVAEFSTFVPLVFTWVYLESPFGIRKQ
ncbi:MAG TPA: hypothetical protein DCY07_02060 [Rhodospirillaceae bacterium]|nr:hypothetical protein [Rhodospirillaceae bacterium]